MWLHDSMKSCRVRRNNHRQTTSRSSQAPGVLASPLRLRHVLLIVALVATLVRLVYVLETKDHLYWLTPLVDAADFHQRAMQVAQGEGLAGPAEQDLVVGVQTGQAHRVDRRLGVLVAAQTAGRMTVPSPIVFDVTHLPRIPAPPRTSP